MPWRMRICVQRHPKLNYKGGSARWLIRYKCLPIKANNLGSVSETHKYAANTFTTEPSLQPQTLKEIMIRMCACHITHGVGSLPLPFCGFSESKSGYQVCTTRSFNCLVISLVHPECFKKEIETDL